MHVGETGLQRLLDIDLRFEEVAAELGNLVKLGGGELHLLVFEQAAHQLCARVFGLFAFCHLLGRQQHARLDFNQHGCHQQVFGCEF